MGPLPAEIRRAAEIPGIEIRKERASGGIQKSRKKEEMTGREEACCQRARPPGKERRKMSIQINDLTVTFKNGVTAVKHADLTIPKGIYGLLGENGAGKTTLMRVLTTLLKPSGGSVTLDGVMYAEQNYEKIRRRIGYLPQEIDLYPQLTVQECLEYMGELAGVEKGELKGRIEKYLDRTSLLPHRKKKMRQLSGGMKRRVGLVQALLHEPEFLIIDEPTTGLDPEERIRIRNLLVDFSENRTVLFSTHVVEDLAATCNRLAVMKKGEFLFAGEMRELLEMARDSVWSLQTDSEAEARKLEREYLVSAKQFGEGGIRLRLLAKECPDRRCVPEEATLEDAYIWITHRD